MWITLVIFWPDENLLLQSKNMHLHSLKKDKVQQKCRSLFFAIEAMQTLMLPNSETARFPAKMLVIP